MFCHACGARSGSGDRVCLACGRPLSVPCASCLVPNPPTADFCAACGAKSGAEEAALRRGVDSQPPPRLRSRAQRARRTLEGERKQVTVMFADIKGSLSLIAGRDAEQAQGLLDSLLESMTSAVHEYEGTVNQVLGDGFVALFGAPIAHEDHALRAACAALAIQDAVRKGHPLWHSLGVTPQVRIGLSSGDVVIRAIDNDLNVDYRAVGQTTHLAARMEQTAPAGTVRMTSETMRLVEGFVQARRLPPVAVKGLREPVEAYEALSVTEAASRLRARRAELSPFVGREPELHALRTAVSLCDHQSSVFSLCAEAGLGKSRLAHELLISPETRDAVKIESRALSYRRHSPFLVLKTLLHSLLDIEESDEADVVEQKLAGVLSEELEAARVPLLSLLGAAPDHDEYRRLDPAERRKRVVDGVMGLLKSRAANQKLVLLIEDLHWADEESLSFVRSLIERLPKARAFVLLTYRPEFAARVAEDCVNELVLSPLATKAAQELLDGLMVADAASASAGGLRMRKELLERTQGNPFFLEECLRSLSDAGVFEREGNRYRLVDASAAVSLPYTAEAVIAARIDRLSEQHKALLQTASVIGTDIPRSLLLSVAGGDEDEVCNSVQALVDSGMLQEVDGPGRLPWRFRHALIHDTAYGGMLRTQRAVVHARVVTAMERNYAGQLAEYADQLAEHCERATQWSQAIRYHLLSCTHAASRFANHEAVSAVDRGLEALTHVAPGKPRDKAAVDLRLAALAPLMPLGRKERMVSLLKEAESVAEELGDPQRLGAVYSQLSTALWLVSDHEAALKKGNQALAIAEKTGHFPLQLSARYNVAMCRNGLGQYTEAVSMLSELWGMLSGPLREKRFGWATYPSVSCKTFLGLSLTMLGELNAAQEHMLEGKELADRLQHPYSQAIVTEELGYCKLVMGELDEGRHLLESCLALCQEHEVHTMYPAAAGRLGLALVLLNRAPEAVALMEDALSRRTYEAGSNYVRFYLEYALARARVAEGKIEAALATAHHVVALTRSAHEHGHHACSVLLLADILTEAGHIQDAEEQYMAALVRAEQLHMRPVAAACLRGLRELYARNSRLSQALEFETRAAAAYTSLGITAAEQAIV